MSTNDPQVNENPASSASIGTTMPEGVAGTESPNLAATAGPTASNAASSTSGSPYSPPPPLGQGNSGSAAEGENQGVAAESSSAAAAAPGEPALSAPNPGSPAAGAAAPADAGISAPAAFAPGEPAPVAPVPNAAAGAPAGAPTPGAPAPGAPAGAPVPNAASGAGYPGDYSGIPGQMPPVQGAYAYQAAYQSAPVSPGAPVPSGSPVLPGAGTAMPPGAPLPSEAAKPNSVVLAFKNLWCAQNDIWQGKILEAFARYDRAAAETGNPVAGWLVSFLATSVAFGLIFGAILMVIVWLIFIMDTITMSAYMRYNPYAPSFGTYVLAFLVGIVICFVALLLRSVAIMLACRASGIAANFYQAATQIGVGISVVWLPTVVAFLLCILPTWLVPWLGFLALFIAAIICELVIYSGITRLGTYRRSPIPAYAGLTAAAYLVTGVFAVILVLIFFQGV